MRRSRGLTRYEQWDLALMLALLTVGLLCLTVTWRSGALPRLFAFASSSGSSGNREMTVSSVTTSLDAHKMQLAQLPIVSAAAPQPIILPMQPSVPALFTPLLPPATHKSVVPKTAAVYQWYNGQKYRFLKTMRMRVTAYAPDARCCWPYDGTTTASGVSVHTNKGKLVAADTRLLPFHSLVSVAGYHGGEAVPVLDRGGAIKGSRLDVLIPTFSQAQEWGTRVIDVKIFVPVDDE
jgi:3D (Asp-Asp-Asp) domain-containing protein